MPIPLDPAIAGAGLVVGFVVGLTGMGGGSLTTPLLILVFRIPSVAAVGSDLVASVAMKLVGGGIHARARTVRWDLVGLLSLSSIPAAVAGVVALRVVGPDHVEALVPRAVGLALVAGAMAIILRLPWVLAHLSTTRAGSPLLRLLTSASRAPRPRPTLVLGALVGVLVGLTSVGSGSLVVTALAFLYPGLTSAELVGTDLVQGFFLVSAAAATHALIGDVRLALVASLLAGAIPGVVAGARLSSRAPDRIVRPVLAGVLLTTGLKMI